MEKKGHILGYGYGSLPINTMFRGINIHLPAILMFTIRIYYDIWGFPGMGGTPKWIFIIMDNPIKMDDFGVPLF